MLLASDCRDRPLARLVEVDESAPLRSVDRGCMDGDSVPFELRARARSARVAAQRREEVDGVRELRELQRSDRPSPRGLLPGARGVDDLSRTRNRLDRNEFEPLHMT